MPQTPRTIHHYSRTGSIQPGTQADWVHVTWPNTGTATNPVHEIARCLVMMLTVIVLLGGGLLKDARASEFMLLAQQDSGLAPDATSELEQAYAEYRRAYERYTSLVTGGGGDEPDLGRAQQEALTEYRNAYQRYQRLKAQQPQPAARPSPPSLTSLPESGLAPTAEGDRVEHASGTVLISPEGALHQDVTLDLREIPNPPSTAPFEQKGTAIAVDGVMPAPPGKPVEIQLPASGENPAVMFFSLGEWIRLPARNVTLPNGDPGLAVNLERVPMPWLLTVADAPEAGEPELAGAEHPLARMAHLEQLRLTDQAAFLAAFQRDSQAGLYPPPTSPRWLGLLVRSATARSSHGGGIVPELPCCMEDSQEDGQEDSQNADLDAARELLCARLMFLRADAAMRLGDEQGARTARRRYLDGLHHLDRAARAVRALDQDGQDQGFADQTGTDSRLAGFSRDHVYGGELSLRDMTEYYLGTFAPWGLRLTKAILEGEDQVLLPGFDIRVLPFFGHEPHLDLQIPGDYVISPAAYPHQPTIDYFQQALLDYLQIEPGRHKTHVTLRLYSPRIYEYSTHEYYSMLKNAVGGASYLLGLGKLAFGAPVAGTGAALYSGYSVVAPIIERAFVEPQAQRLSDAGIASVSSTLTLYSGNKLLGKVVLDGAPEALLSLDTLEYAGMLTDMVMSYYIDHAELQSIESLRSEGSTTGYRNASAWFWQHDRFHRPPMAFVVNMDGFTNHRPEQASGSYTVSGHGRFKLFVDYDKLDVLIRAEDLSRQFVVREFSPETERRIGNGIVFGSPEGGGSMRRDDLLGIPVRRPNGFIGAQDVTAWAEVNFHDNAPSGKLLQFTLEEELLGHWRDATEHSSVEEWMERVEVELVPESGRPVYVYMGDNNLLGLHQAFDSRGGIHRFGLGITESPPEIDTLHNRLTLLNATDRDSTGDYSTWVWAFPIGNPSQLSLRYKVNLTYEGTTLASFDVNYEGLGPEVVKKTIEPTGRLRRDLVRTLHNVTYELPWQDPCINRVFELQDDYRQQGFMLVSRAWIDQLPAPERQQLFRNLSAYMGGATGYHVEKIIPDECRQMLIGSPEEAPTLRFVPHGVYTYYRDGEIHYQYEFERGRKTNVLVERPPSQGSGNPFGGWAPSVD
ncbi:hypothetical protein LRB11_14920 [Ectothiorhodospira haloalkaliphila]|uniref:hypothetical protein n=1 Tax=Ectothiorhodospira haloalkaliphila TaxID=421628 RepID=UPI001EE829C6|nr:hypothetical protein [Ectothiorhodospira haloalkaliphila]MCG5526206.1 hypothetical protein [Ectothiorhodospira haloalkaliphila]